MDENKKKYTLKGYERIGPNQEESTLICPLSQRIYENNIDIFNHFHVMDRSCVHWLALHHTRAGRCSLISMTIDRLQTDHS